MKVLFVNLVLWLNWSFSCHASDDVAADQLAKFKENHIKPIGTLLKKTGAPVDETEMKTLNENLIFNGFFMDSLTDFARVKLPARPVHGNGAGAFGYFEVTHDITDICKASLFSKIGKKTPVAVRFSSSFGQEGTTDLTRDIRGFAVKFYTEEGNFDFVGFNTPAFAFKDPLLFPSFAFAFGRNGQTYLQDFNAFWDVMTLRPESMQVLTWIFSDYGIPYGYSYINGFSIHTYQIYNENGTSYFARINFYPDWGNRTLTQAEAAKLIPNDPYYFIHQLYNDIENGRFPSWTMKMQVLTLEQVKSAGFDVFDVTISLPEDQYPLRPVGKLVLDKNPKNYFEEVEKLAFCPATLVPGILGAPDKLFEARRFSYRDSQNYRLGQNFHKIPVNCPFAMKRSNNNQDVEDSKVPVNSLGNAPRYVFNSFNGPVAYKEFNKPKLIEIVQHDTYSFEQPRKIYLEMSDDHKSRFVSNIVGSLTKVAPFIQERAIDLFYEIHPDLGNLVNRTLTSSINSYIHNVNVSP